MQTNLLQLPALKQMENLARGMTDVVSLSQGIPYLPSDDAVRIAVIDALLQGKVDRYSESQGLLSLRKLISQKLLEEKMNYATEEIIVTAGAIEALTSTLLCLSQSVDSLAMSASRQGEIIIPTPTYSAYFRSATIANLTIKPVLLDEKQGWKLDIAAVKKLITPNTRALLLCNPNNPTGNMYDQQTLDALCELALEHNFSIILDEVYGNIQWLEKSMYTPCINETYRKQIIRIVSFSKDFSLTGWRVGFLHTDASMVKKILVYHDTLVNCAPVISQYAAMACLLNEKKIRSYTKQIYTEQRLVMGKLLAEIGDKVSFVVPDGAYFFFPKIHGVSNDIEFCYDLLDKAKVAVVPGSDFGSGGEGHIRLCFGRDPNDIVEGMKRLKGYIKNYA